MTHLNPPDAAALDEVKNELDFVAAAMGFEPNSMKVMAHRPNILRGFLALMGMSSGRMPFWILASGKWSPTLPAAQPDAVIVRRTPPMVLTMPACRGKKSKRSGLIPTARFSQRQNVPPCRWPKLAEVCRTRSKPRILMRSRRISPMRRLLKSLPLSLPSVS